jgi:hypothetical protein
MSNMKATSLVQTRLIYAENAFAELVLWQLPKPLPGSIHPFKYRLAYVVEGDHRHFGKRESKYLFTTPENLLSDFQQEIRRHQRENNHP